MSRPHWRDNARFEVYPDRKVSFGDPAEIAVVSGHYADNVEVEIAEAKANADLISAAPDLLDALKDARYALYGNGPANPKIDAAIAKAEGRS
jgi:hypothetical protein